MRGTAFVLGLVSLAALAGIARAQGPAVPNPILFVTQTPNGTDFANLMSTFGTHRGDATSAPRGGDLWIRYPDGSRRNLTLEAGYGTTPGQEIAVRDPMPSFDGTRALFSMAIGGTGGADPSPVFFQLYEATGFGVGQSVQIRKLAQPAGANNVSPIYASDGRILFTSDRPRNGDPRLYPQLDEYETTPTVTGLWSMRADGSELAILDHAPSGLFEPFVDSFGRVIVTRWDHLQRDQQAVNDIQNLIAGSPVQYGAITYESESSDSFHALAPGDETFPEQRTIFANAFWDLGHQASETEHVFNFFFPWMMNQDGSAAEILNHLGRHELARYVAPARTYLSYANGIDVDIFQHIAEDPTSPGRYLGIRCPEFGSRSAGQIVSIAAPPGANPDTLPIEFLTHPVTGAVLEANETPTADHAGLFRDPVVLADGRLFASHSSNPFREAETAQNPPAPQPYTLSSRNDFAIRELVPGANGYRIAGVRLTDPIVESVSYFDRVLDRTVQYAGPLWELQPVEVRVRSAPPEPADPMPALEAAILQQELGAAGTAQLREWMRQRDLALISSRDVTVRADRQQDYNLAIAWSDHRTAEPASTPKQLGWLQVVEARQLRGFDLFAGRRILPRPIASALNPRAPGAPPGAVRLGDDGSMAAFVPARRALSWQTMEADGTPAVRERYWLTFQPGEIRNCTNCHGLNTVDVFGGGVPQNEPAALRDLVVWWRDVPEPGAQLSALAAIATLCAVRGRAQARRPTGASWGAR